MNFKAKPVVQRNAYFQRLISENKRLSFAIINSSEMITITDVITSVPIKLNSIAKTVRIAFNAEWNKTQSQMLPVNLFIAARLNEYAIKKIENNPKFMLC